jgi:hypothetical protein
MIKSLNQARVDALAQLKEGDGIIREGRKELAAANTKIAQPQRLIDESANILRGTWGAWKPSSPNGPSDNLEVQTL